jgi:hypothetical protein
VLKLLNLQSLKIDIEDLRSNKRILWNLLYYFNEHSLTYWFLLPYDEIKRLSDFIEMKK